MPRKNLEREMLLSDNNEKTIKDLMSMSKNEEFVNTVLYNRVGYNMYIEAYKYNHSIRNDEDLPDYLKDLVSTYKLFDQCAQKLPDDLYSMYKAIFKQRLSLDVVAKHHYLSKTSIHRYKNLIVKALANCLHA